MTIQDAIDLVKQDELYIKINGFCDSKNSVVGPYNYGYKHAIENILKKLDNLKGVKND